MGYARVPIDAARLRELRRARGWSQHRLSVEVGVQGGATVSAWETGATVPHPRTLLKVAEVLGVAPGSLLAGAPEGFGLAELRVTAGLSRRALARESNASMTTVRRWEAGDFKRMPGRGTLVSVADALGVPLPVLVEALQTSRRAAQA